MLAHTKTKILLLDDDEPFLDVLSFFIHEQLKENVIIKPFLNSSDCISFIQENCYSPDTVSEILNSFYRGPINQLCAAQTLKELSELSAVLVLDQELKEEHTNGINLSYKIREYFPSSYICMLTSTIPDNLAIDLHNNHSIDLFIDKKNPLAFERLYSYLLQYIHSKNDEYSIDPVDIFQDVGILEDETYINLKNELLNVTNYIAFITLNNAGELIIMKENRAIDCWRYDPKKQRFYTYEL